MPVKTFMEMLQVNLDMSTGDRLLLAADIIEAHPENHNQHVWVSSLDDGAYIDMVADPLDVTNGDVEVSCGAAFCAAGLGVLLTPPELIPASANWWYAGSVAFGLGMPNNYGFLTYPVADRLFHSENGRAQVVEAMRYLASLDDGDRTIEALDDQGYTHEWFTGEDE